MAELLRARGAGRPIDLRPLFASLRKPSTDRLHLTRDQFIVLALVRTYERADGWSAAPGELGWSHRNIGVLTGTSQAYAKHVVRDLRRRNVLRTTAESADGKDGLANALRITVPAEWTLLTPEQKKPRPKSYALRVQRRGDRMALVTPAGVAEIPAESETRIGALGADAAVTIRGEVSVRVSERADVQLSSALKLAEEPKRAERVPGSPATPVRKSNPEDAQSVPGSPATPGPAAVVYASQLYRLRDGVLKAEWPETRRFLTAAERRELARLLSSTPGVDTVAQFFAVAGMRTAVIERFAATPAPSAKKKAVQLDGPPTGLWARALHILQGRVNRHSFESWFLGTREAGTLNGGIVIAVGTRLHVQRLHKQYGEQIREVLQRIAHRDLRFQFVATDGSDDLEILAPPDSGAEAGENLQRRTA